MLGRLAARLADWAQRRVPDPFVIALALTAVAFAAGWWLMPESSAAALAEGWYARVTDAGTLAFTFQMSLILVAGAALARAPAVAGLLARLAARPTTSAGAAALTAFVAMSAAYLNWGFGLIVGALLAREIGARAAAAGRPLNYPLVVAAGYTGLMVWHGGLSGSAPLKAAEEGPAGVPIPLSETIFSPLNLGFTAASLVFVPWLLTRMARGGGEARVVVAAPARDRLDDEQERRTPGGWLLLLFIVALGGLALSRGMRAGLLAGLSLNTVNLLLVLGGLLLFGSPQRYASAFAACAGQAGGILLQFPFYFGVLGLLEASGLVTRLAAASADAARALAQAGLPLGFSFDTVTFLSAALVNLFVPSGGGQWAVQGGIVAAAAAELQLPVARAVVALSWGDEWTNMLQPFWALPLLGLTGLKARDILGYTLLIMVFTGPLYLAAIALL